MKVTKIVKNKEVKKRFTNVDLRNTKSSIWNTKRRFGL